MSRKIKKFERVNEELHTRNDELEKKNKELAEISQYKSEFLSRISHDIRTPLNSIVNLTEMLEKELDDPDAMKRDIRKMKLANRFLVMLVNDILDMSCINQNRMELHPELYTYSEFTEYIISTFTPLCKEKNIHFDLDLDIEGVDIMIDKDRLNQLCFNLLVNAIKYTPDGGRICFRITCVAITEDTQSLDFYVIDNGIGMTEDFQQKMFEPFTQEGRVYETVEGTGLGLAIVKQIIALLNGTIEVTSSVNQGTTIHFHLDTVIANPADKMKYLQNSDVSKLKGSHILVAEDHHLNQEIIKRLLESENMQVTVTQNGKETVDEFETHPDFYDAILMDIRMPIMDGITATYHIRNMKHERAKSIPIIALSASAFAEDQTETINAGMNAHLTKPIDTKKLYKTLEKFVCCEA